MRDETCIGGNDNAFRAVFEAAPEALAIISHDGRLLKANRAARELEVGLDSLPQTWHGARASTEVRMVDRRGITRVLEVEQRPLDAGRLIALRDVTEQRGLEEALSHYRRVESLGYLTATVVHDFNNLLMPIVCTSELLVDELDRGSRARSMAAEIRMAAERATALVRELMRLARRQPSTPQRVNVNEAINDLRALMARGLPENTELSLVLDGARLDVVVDRERLESALLNLVANARDAMPQGGQISISTASLALGDDPAAPLEGTMATSYVSIAVTDSGEGMPLAVRERLFERFFTTKGAQRGTGLGLPSVHGFVAQSGGCISVRSGVGEGTTVILYLPRAPARDPGPVSTDEPSGVRESSPERHVS
jgi:signal transduction histidine kinase